MLRNLIRVFECTVWKTSCFVIQSMGCAFKNSVMFTKTIPFIFPFMMKIEVGYKSSVCIIFDFAEDETGGFFYP